ncbi:lipoprotein NlpI, partial [Vibrio makurazakiensis]
ALYYGGRTELALEDMTAHYEQDPQDPFRVLWLSLIESEIDEKAALENLKTRSKNHNDEWGWVLVGITLGEINEESAVQVIMESTQNNRMMAERLTEAYFYLGKRYEAEGNVKRALCVYKLAISLNVFDYVEHSYSFIELDRIFKEYKAARQAQATGQNFVNVRN